MHIDMHYAGTYAMAKLAGLNDEAARQIGNSAQFVDDAAEDIAVMFEDTGHFYASEISARHTGKIDYMRESHVYMRSYVDQLNIWVPFHFLPGNKGKTLTQRLVCQPDSKIAQEMIQSHVNQACKLKKEGKPWGNYLVGVAAHVYADTFAHYGFSGISSRRNLVKGSSIGELNSSSEYGNELLQAFADKAMSMWGKFPNIKHMIFSHAGEKSTSIDGGTMGHPGVGVLPDLPYLVYEFQYDCNEKLLNGGQPQAPRSNPRTYLDACRKMHGHFSRYADLSNQKDNKSYRKFSGVAGEISEILDRRDPDADNRLKYWQKQSRKYWGIEIPNYEGRSWQKKFMKSKTDTQVLASDAYRFYRASAHHKMVVLDKILPKHGINLECRQFRAGSYS